MSGGSREIRRGEGRLMKAISQISLLPECRGQEQDLDRLVLLLGRSRGQRRVGTLLC